MRRTIILLPAALSFAALAASAGAQDSGQGFFRVVEGEATVVRAENGRPDPARENAPALTGDRVWLDRGARVELILPDGHRLRLAEAADVELVTLAQAFEEDPSAATVLRVLAGALALDVPADAVDRTRVDTDPASAFLEPGGLYLVEVDAAGYTRVVVRSGAAELVTVEQAVDVREGEEAEVAPDRRARVRIAEAPRLTDVEVWAEQLEAEAARAAQTPLEPELRYAALPLERHGSWLYTETGQAWRPHAAAGWRPYWDGYWTYSPAGLVWSSHEPWGWVPYHYGQWDLHPAHGWLWYPGAVYAPAHVVWYWGASHVAWIPSGYYRSFYHRRFGFDVSFGRGFYGVSHADWRAYRDWVFCPSSSIGLWHQHRFHSDHRVLASHDRVSSHRRAFITADTQGLAPGSWRRPAAAEGEILRRAHRRTGSEPQLADVSTVVARSPDVSAPLLQTIARRDDDLRSRVGTHRVAAPRVAASRVAAGDAAPVLDRAGPTTPRAEARRASGIDAQHSVAAPVRSAAHRPSAAAPRVVAAQPESPAPAAGSPVRAPRPYARPISRAESPAVRDTELRARPTSPRVTPARPPEARSPAAAPRVVPYRATEHRSAPPAARTPPSRSSLSRPAPSARPLPPRAIGAPVAPGAGRPAVAAPRHRAQQPSAVGRAAPTASNRRPASTASPASSRGRQAAPRSTAARSESRAGGGRSARRN